MQNEEMIMAAVRATAHKKEDRFKAVKDFLYQVRDAQRRVKMVERRIDYRMDSLGAHGVNYDEYIPSGHDYSGSVVESTVVALTELQRELDHAEQAYADAKVTVSDLIARLPDINQQTVITRRYVDGQAWEKIALDMDMTVRNMQKIHGRALPLLQEYLEGQKVA